MATATQWMSAEEFLALPDDGVHRELIRGELREHPEMTMRGRPHGVITMRLGQILCNWLDDQPEPRGIMVGGETRVILRRDPDQVVGIDAAYVSRDVASRSGSSDGFIGGPPAVAVEFWSPSDTHAGVNDKIRDDLDSGVRQVWIIDPRIRTLTVCRPDAEPVMYNARQELAGEPEMPGFRVLVGRFFER